jgi:hypothetical protein
MTGPDGGALACFCGVFAVATCSECRTPLCGDHLRRWNERAVCGTHQQMLSEQHASRTREASLERFLQGWAELAEWIMTVANDPVERFLRALYWAPEQPEDLSDDLRLMVGGTLDRLLGTDRARWTKTRVSNPDAWTIQKSTLLDWVWTHKGQAKVEKVKFLSQPFHPFSGITVPSGSALGIYLGETVKGNSDQRQSTYRNYLLRDGRQVEANPYTRKVWPGQTKSLPNDVGYDTLTQIVRAVMLSQPSKLFGR